MQVIGGIKGTLDMWEMGIIPSLMNNCETWTEIEDADITKLENLQNLFLRTIFQVPISCPKAALNWETGTKLMKFRIIEKKLNFTKYLQQCEETSLANEIFKEQDRHKFPGLLKECKELAKGLNIKDEFENTNVSTKEFKGIVKKTINYANETELLAKLSKLEKCPDLKNEGFGLKKYFDELNVTQTRIKFRLRANMTQVKFNFKNDSQSSRENWTCDSCETCIESQSHIMWCEAYSHLRNGLNINSDKDLVKYVNSVMKIRHEMKLSR